LDASAALLTGEFDFTLVGTEGTRTRFAAPGDTGARFVDLVESAGQGRGRLGAGSIHHIAFRNRDDAAQLAWRDGLLAAGLHVTEIRDRQYFHSIYFREPSGVLFELATDPPGFLWDEDPATLGMALRLPPWLEAQRSEIERRLPAIVRPGEVEV
jgi:glyoxalase family protein